MMQVMRTALPLAVAVLACACGPLPGPGGLATPADGGAALDLSRTSLVTFAKGESWKSWPSEPAPHDSAGPHGGKVRTWLNPELLASLKAGNDKHPNASIAVKELYDDLGARRGFAVAVKNDEGKWVFWEGFEPSLDQYYFVGTGNPCANCHSTGKDFLLTEASAFP